MYFPSTAISFLHPFSLQALVVHHPELVGPTVTCPLLPCSSLPLHRRCCELQHPPPMLRALPKSNITAVHCFNATWGRRCKTASGMTRCCCPAGVVMQCSPALEARCGATPQGAPVLRCNPRRTAGASMQRVPVLQSTRGATQQGVTGAEMHH